MAGTGPAGNTATLNLILGVFLKLLGFFVLLYGYTEVDPVKAHKAELSIQQRFNISVNLMPEHLGVSKISTAPVQTQGRSYEAISSEMKSQVDFLSSEYDANSDTLILRVPLNVVLPVDDKPAKSANFAEILTQTLDSQHAADSVFAIEIVTIGKDDTALVAAASLFVQKMLSESYPRDLLTIGYQAKDQDPMIEFRIKQVHV